MRGVTEIVLNIGHLTCIFRHVNLNERKTHTIRSLDHNIQKLLIGPVQKRNLQNELALPGPGRIYYSGKNWKVTDSEDQSSSPSCDYSSRASFGTIFESLQPPLVSKSVRFKLYCLRRQNIKVRRGCPRERLRQAAHTSMIREQYLCRSFPSSPTTRQPDIISEFHSLSYTPLCNTCRPSPISLVEVQSKVRDEWDCMWPS